MHSHIMTDLGKEKRCARCGEYWPADKEFFYQLPDGRLHSYCHACFIERKKELRKGAIKKYERKK